MFAQICTPQKAYENAIRREKGIEQSRTMKSIRSVFKHLRPQNKNKYITLIHLADKTNSTNKTINEVGEVFSADNFQVDHRTQGVSNISNNETQIPNNVSSVEINIVSQGVKWAY